MGRTEHKDFMVRKLIDKASPKLFEACCAGKHLKDVTLEICRAGGDKQKYLEIKFEQILVSKYNANSFLSHEFPAEEIQFNYGKVKVTYTQQQRHSGATSGNVSAGWDLTTNKAMA